MARTRSENSFPVQYRDEIFCLKLEGKELVQHNKDGSLPIKSEVKHTKNKFRRHNETFNLLDYVVERKENKSQIKKEEATDTVKQNKGKTREIPRKKRNNRLKRTILENRQIKSSCDESVNKSVSENLVTALNTTLTKLDLNTSKTNEFTLHSRKFRPYCDNTTSPELCRITENLIRGIYRFQKNSYEKNPIKGRAHKRYVLGFREVAQQILIKKVKLVIIAPDCESCELPGGVDDTIKDIKQKCREGDIPYLFALKRRKLGNVLFKKTAISCVGVLNYDGTQDSFHQLIECLEKERKTYNKLITCQPEVGVCFPK